MVTNRDGFRRVVRALRKEAERGDPETLRTMADRWDNPTATPLCVVWIGSDTYTAGHLLRILAVRMDEALESEENPDGE